jgi:vitamin B12 transporter
MDAPPDVEIVVVGQARLPEAPGERVFSAFIIDEASLEEAIRLDDALREAPGVSLFRRGGSGASNPTIQGLAVRSTGPSGAGRALVTLDGVPQNDPFGGWVIWGGLPPELITGASIVRGAGAGPYGAGALTGVVSLHERAAPGFMFSAEGGDFGYGRVAGLGEAAGGGVDVLLAAAAEHQDGWIPVRAGRGAADAPLTLDALTGAARVQTQIGRAVASARVSGYAEDRGSGQIGAASSASGASASFTLVAAPQADRVGWRLQAWLRQSDLASTFVSVAPDRSATTPANDQFETPTLGWGINAAARWGDDDGGFELGADMRAADGETHERFRFMAGDFTRLRVAGGETLVAGAYVETWRAIDDWLFAGGARLDTWRATSGVRRESDLASGALTLNAAPEEADALVPTARLGARRAFGDHFLRASAYAGFRPPTLNELHRPFRVGNDITEANPILDPERLYGFDLGFGADHASLSWEIGAFVTRLEDPITNVTIGAGPGTFPPGVFVPAGGVFRVRQNAGRIDAIGIETQARGALGALGWRAALNYTDARVEADGAAAQLDGLRPAQSPRLSVNAGADWRLSEATTLSGDVFYESMRFEDDLNTRELPAATSLDLRLTHRIAGPATLFLALDNVTDAAIATGQAADGVTSYGAPRALRVGLRISR